MRRLGKAACGAARPWALLRLWLCLLGGLAALPAAAITEIDGGYTLETVHIIASPDFRNIYAEVVTPSYLAVIATPTYSRSWLAADFYVDYLEFVATRKMDPATTTDVRCNIGATEQTKLTTSTMSVTDRFLAAAQLFGWIRGVDAGRSARAIVRERGSYFYNGAQQYTFEVTYADGGKEAWIVASVFTGALVNEGNVPNSLVLGNGTVQSCPGLTG